MATRLGVDLHSALDSQALALHDLRYAATRCGECRSNDLCDPLFDGATPPDMPEVSAPDYCPNRLLYDRLKLAAS